jgi:hypothetical protein
MQLVALSRKLLAPFILQHIAGDVRASCGRTWQPKAFWGPDSTGIGQAAGDQHKGNAIAGNGAGLATAKPTGLKNP